MSSRTVAFSVLVCLLSLGVPASGETLNELVKKEEGVEFGPCALSPRPKLAGDSVYAVIPARFDKPGIWVTRTLLLVGVDAQTNVQGMLELKLADDVPPRQVVNVTCTNNRLVIKLPRKSLPYGWNGSTLRKR